MQKYKEHVKIQRTYKNTKNIQRTYKNTKSEECEPVSVGQCRYPRDYTHCLYSPGGRCVRSIFVTGTSEFMFCYCFPYYIN